MYKILLFLSFISYVHAAEKEFEEQGNKQPKLSINSQTSTEDQESLKENKKREPIVEVFGEKNKTSFVQWPSGKTSWVSGDARDIWKSLEQLEKYKK